MNRQFSWPKLLFPLLLVSGGASAQSGDEFKNRIAVELNTAQSTEEACILTFQVINAFDAEIGKVVYETVLFDTDGGVERLTLFDFGALPAGRPRVRQFSVQGTRCEGLGRILINGAQTCVAEGLEESVCETGLELSTRTDIEVAG